MNDRKNSFIMYNNYINYFTLLSYEDRGVLITAILEYANNRSVSIELEGAADSVPAIEQVRNEICPCGQVKSLRGEIFASQM